MEVGVGVGIMNIADEVWMIMGLLMICGEGSQSHQQMAVGISAQYSSTTLFFF